MNNGELGRLVKHLDDGLSRYLEIGLNDIHLSSYPTQEEEPDICQVVSEIGSHILGTAHEAAAAITQPHILEANYQRW